ncbi:MAG TPA: acyl--CoA ligase [Candidatus Aphodocola excrementigallinarum]|uniref:Acyl--CoA ligase n=1 Tax=Candidatus Aphodocola excrementigallinarum TaxID=2840670 RepID=A0A9D1LIM8_9FIRM|nr:acyl--CoA ligase [Candidatus Aphodocola excrementigallinarum]
MKIGINKDISNFTGIKNELNNRGYEVATFSTSDISDIIDFTKKERINAYVGLPNQMCNIVKESPSISTSTYLINDYQNIGDKVDQISKNRKPSEEKIWNRYYTDEQLKKPFPEMTKNDFVRSKNIDQSLVALEYFGKKVTYGEYDKKIVEYSKKLETLGIKPGDSVALCLPNTIETMLLIAAMDENAIVCNNIFPLESAEKIKECINMMGSKVAFVLDSRYKDLDKIANKTTLTDAYLVSPFESLPIMKKAMDLKGRLEGNNPKESDFKLFKDFLNLKETDFERAKYKKDRLSSIQYTSGTTGVPKAVMLTDDSLNARAHQYEQLDVGLEKQMRFLQVIPICGKAYGEFTMHLGLSNGLVNDLLPTFDSKKLLGTIVKEKGQGVSLPPRSYDNVIESPDFKKTDMSNYKLISLGAENATKKHIELIEEAFKRQGYKETAILGAGGTELGVTFSTNTHKFNERGTSGFPLIGNNVRIVDENGNELSYNQNGEVIYSAVSPSIGYANKDINLKKDDFGIDLGDYGYINENGNLTVLSRTKDLFNVNGRKISSLEIEEMIDKCPYVKYAYAVAPKNSNNKFRICYIPFENVEIDNLDEEIMNYVPDEFKSLTEVYRITDVPIAASLKSDRDRLAGDISELVYKENSKIKKKKPSTRK